MGIYSLGWRRAIGSCALVAIGALASVGSAQATTVTAFEFDTQYKAAGTIYWGVLGALTLGQDSRLYYDSGSKQLSFSGTLNSSRGSYTFEFDLGQAKQNKHKTEFAFPNNSFAPQMAQIGTLTPNFNLAIFGQHHPLGKAAAGTHIPVFGHGMPASLWAESGHLVFQNWVKLWGQPLGFDIAADPRFTLTKIPGGGGGGGGEPVPEPMSMALLATGLLGAAAKRKRATNN